jgi:hypothetical protein
MISASKLPQAKHSKVRANFVNFGYKYSFKDKSEKNMTKYAIEKRVNDI